MEGRGRGIPETRRTDPHDGAARSLRRSLKTTEVTKRKVLVTPLSVKCFHDGVACRRFYGRNDRKTCLPRSFSEIGIGALVLAMVFAEMSLAGVAADQFSYTVYRVLAKELPG